MSGAPASKRLPRRRFFIPEVIQTSGMDCGPAALKALLEGFGIPVSYGRLREACHTDVDGTSIDTLEAIAQALELSAEQIMLPLDHVLLKESAALPAIAVARTPTGGAHFIVIWRRHGSWVQVLDPARGRLWLPRGTVLGQMYRHSALVGAKAWRDWAGSDAFLVPLRRRLGALGLSARATAGQIESATEDLSWRGLARMDASVRMMQELRDSRAIRRSGADSALRALLNGSQEDAPVPDHYWSVQPADPEADGTERLHLRGAVLVRARGRLSPSHGGHAEHPRTPDIDGVRSPELAAALAEPPARPLHDVFAALRADGALTPVVAACAIIIATLGVVFEAVLLRSVLDVSALLTLPAQGLAAGGVLALFAAAMLGIEVALASAERRAGSHLEARLRLAFLAKIPRLTDSYFQSRPISDMLERSHGAHLLRMLPPLGIRFLRTAAELVVTTAAIAWIDPRMAGLALLSCAAAAGIPLIGNSLMAERDLKVRTHAGALARFHLDALLGRTAIEAHGAESTIEREHERLLAEWVRASLALQRGSVVTEGLQMLVGFGLAGWLLFGHFAGGIGGAMLLMTYWVLNLPALGYELALTAREYPAHRSTILRLLEPLGAPDARDVGAHTSSPARGLADSGVQIDARHVTVRVAGNPVLESVNLHVEAGSHVAIVGASGAGKSTLVGLLLGWYRPAAGELLVDGEPLTGDRLDLLRSETAWVDPTLQIWNRSLLENLLYGSDCSPQSLTPVLESAALLPVIAKLPQGLATPLGESGSLLSAGEGQRVRLGRAMMRQGARLVILDEPFLGLERERRRMLLGQSRRRWAGRTLLYVTHDVTETRGFDRVLVMERGRIVEDDEPLQLAQMASSRYRRLLQAQEMVHARLTTGAEWKRVRLEAGEIAQEHAGSTIEQRA
jgi:ABC-type bacteriocin/lantibiotic exporter with double-glycine peptidase domain